MSKPARGSVASEPKVPSTTRNAAPLHVAAIERASAAGGGAIARYRRFGAMLAASDAVCIVVALVISHELRFWGRGMPLRYWLVTISAPVLWTAVYYAFGLYAPHHLSPAEIFRRIIGATSVGVVLIVVVSFWTRSPFSRAWIATTWIVALALELILRRAWAWRFGRLRREGPLSFGTLIVGADEDGARLARELSAPGTGFTPLGYVAVGPSRVSSGPYPVLGDLDDLTAIIRGSGADCLFVAATAIDAESMRQVTQAARQDGLEVRVAANLPQILTSRLTVQQVGHTMALSLKPVRLTGAQSLAKRAFDLVLAGCAFVFTLPLFGAIAVAIRLTSPGPILFRQQRVTRGGRVFTVYKFRTMSIDGARLLAERSLDPSAPFFKLEDDPRLTSLGRVLRRCSLDELPQLLNVIKGDMSLVGPRPLPVDQVEANAQLLRDRHEVLGGVTGWWQINGRSSLTPEEAVNFDIFYIENWSLALDMYILLKTVGTILNQRGAI